MQTDKEADQVSLFDHDGCAGRMCPAHSAAGHPRARIFASSSRKSSELKAIPFMSLDLTPGHGNLLGESYWELISPWLGGSSTLNTGPAPLSEEDVYSLSQILQDNPPRKYYLSITACLGILRRAKERGKELPPQLEAALMAQAGLVPVDTVPSSALTAFAANQRDEVRDLHDVAGALGAQPGMKQQTFIAGNPANPLFTAGFCAGASPSAGSIGYQEEVSPTLKAAASGNMMPTILCLNDQGGSVMECTENVTGTLRAQEHGHQPLVMGTQQGGAEIMIGLCPTITAAAGMSGNNQPVLFENHGIDARYTGPHPVSPTITARAGTGGCNLPLALQSPDTICISGNAIDRQPQNGGNGIGYQEDIAYTLTATDHAVYSRQRVDIFKDDDIASTESARQHKDATDLILQAARETTNDALSGQCISQLPQLIRRLTPLECERLQGFPDCWTALPGASDAARYKALGNSVAIPCVEFIMQGIAMTLGKDKNHGI